MYDVCQRDKIDSAIYHEPTNLAMATESEIDLRAFATESEVDLQKSSKAKSQVESDMVGIDTSRGQVYCLKMTCVSS